MTLPSLAAGTASEGVARASADAKVVVDARLAGSSGIGTYLRNLVPRLVRRSSCAFEILGGQELHSLESMNRPTVRWQEAPAPVYSLREQAVLSAHAMDRHGLFWSPHYNVPLLRRSRLAVTVHDVAHLALPEYRSSLARRGYAALMYQAVARADARMFDSRFTADEYRRRVGSPGPYDAVIYPGVDEGWFDVERAGSPHPRQYLLYVGNVKPHKNLQRLLDAFELLRDAVPHDLVIVGRREGFIQGDPAVVRRAEGMGGRVAFTGWLSDDAVKQYVACADALVFPSLYEGFGLPPLEAMACGCPVVCSAAASLPEVCGATVLYCDPTDPASIARQVKQILSDSALREELTHAARERARTFTWDRCAAEVGEVLDAARSR